MELKPCPFCGSHQIDLWGDDELGWLAECADCHASAGDCDTKAETIEAWNTRAERTCHDVLGEVEPFECSECHRRINDMKYPNYCWSCGAKVVEE